LNHFAADLGTAGESESLLNQSSDAKATLRSDFSSAWQDESLADQHFNPFADLPSTMALIADE
jgi:hypothetical protein